MNKDFMAVALEAAQEAGQILIDWRGRFKVNFKGHADLVTQADLAAQDAIFRRVTEEYPDHGFVGEEQDEPLIGASDYVWIVDPLDGTTNYVHDLPHYAVSIALARGAELVLGIVLNPATGECYTAERGGGAYLNGVRLATSDVALLSDALVAASLPPAVEEDSTAFRQMVAAMKSTQAIRRFGSAALNLSYVAAGRLDAYWATTVQSWDIAAGMLLVQEAGGSISHVSGSPFHWQRPQIAAASTDSLRQQLLAILETAKESGK